MSEINVAVELGTLFIENRALLTVTGQEEIYHDDDDGDKQKGLAKSYEALTTGQYSGTVNITINGKTVALSNECVKDNRTGLMWARHVPQADIGPDSNGKLFWEDAVNGEDIFAFAQQANANNLGGYSDWYPPNRKQLADLIDHDRANPCIDVTFFPSTPSDYHWTSSTRPDGTTLAFYVHFGYGSVASYDKQSSKCDCRLVRG